eukprot:1140501-Amphidinium_carterae.2
MAYVTLCDLGGCERLHADLAAEQRKEAIEINRSCSEAERNFALTSSTRMQQSALLQASLNFRHLKPFAALAFKPLASAAICKHYKQIPFRNHKLTQLLQDCILHEQYNVQLK